MKTKQKLMAAMMVALFVATMGSNVSAAKKTMTGVVNVNQASVEQLAMLPGIGVKTAAAIRSLAAKAPFQSVEELTKVKGIGEKSLAKLRPFVAVDGPTTAKLSPAPAKQ